MAFGGDLFILGVVAFGFGAYQQARRYPRDKIALLSFSIGILLIALGLYGFLGR